MSRTVWLAALVVFLSFHSEAPAIGLRIYALERLNRRLHGHVVDHTHNHGSDRRIWSAALRQRRNLYVYLPPGYDPKKRYPLMLWLHGFAQDEQSFTQEVVEPLDCAIAAGSLPPMIVAAPDGSLTGDPCVITAGSFFINSKAGRFEDFIMGDVWNFVVQNYPIRPERQAHVIAGVSMGGGGAYNLAIKYRDRFKVVIGIFPPINTRWIDCHGRYMSDFHPDCWGWRTDFTREYEVVGRFYGVVTIRMKDVVYPIYGNTPQTAAQVSLDNPIEMIDRLGLREGELEMYVCYGGLDQFNIAAQVESFVYLARQRGLSITVGYEPRGKHDLATALKFLPSISEWVTPLISPYSP